MIFRDVIVDMPLKKRVTKYGSHKKPYVYEILKRQGKDCEKDTVVCVGLAIDDKKMNPNEKYFEIHPEFIDLLPETKTEKMVFDSQIYLGASVLIRTAAEKTGLTSILEQHYPGYTELIMTLLEYYMIERESAAQLYKYYLYNHFTSLNYIPTEKEISSLFNEVLTHESIQQFLMDWMKVNLKNHSNAQIAIDFDSTNFNIGSKAVEMAERGKPKNDEGLPQVNVAYFLERTSGLPIYYDIYYGSVIDMEHCKTAVGKVKAIQEKASILFVMDRGYFFKKNLDYMRENQYSFLCMGRDGVRMNHLMEDCPVHEISKSVNRIFGGIYGKKFKGKAFESDEVEYYLYLYYNSATAAEELPKRQDFLEYYAKALVGKRDKNYAIRNTYGKMIDLKVDEKNIIVEAKPNYEYLDHYRDTCGYFWIVSTEDLSVEEALNCYRHRDGVEKVFRGIKTDSDLNKMYSQSDAAMEAKNFVAFLTAILRADILLRLKPYLFQYSSETTQTALKELEKIKAEKLGAKYLLRCPLTARQKQILSFYELNQGKVVRYIEDLNLALQVPDN